MQLLFEVIFYDITAEHVSQFNFLNMEFSSNSRDAGLSHSYWEFPNLIKSSLENRHDRKVSNEHIDQFLSG